MKSAGYTGYVVHPLARQVS